VTMYRTQWYQSRFLSNTESE